MNSTQDYRDSYFLKFKLRYAVLALLGVAAVIASTLVLLFTSYLLVCFMDRTPPIENMQYQASDAKIGDTTTVKMSFYRNRICAYSFIRMITDSKGKIVYQEQGSRPVNGPVRQIDLVDEYKIAQNASPGTAIMHLYASWKCPGNIIHEFDPIRKEYTDTLQLSLAPDTPDLSGLSVEDSEDYLENLNKERLIQEQQQSSTKGR